MAALNKVLLMGNLTRDPEVRYTASGTAVADCGLAVSTKRKDAQGEYRENVIFVDCVMWSRTAEIAAEYLHRGAPIFVEGRLELHEWKNQAGEKRSKMQVVVENMQMLSKQMGGDESAQPSPTHEGVDEPANVPSGHTDEGLPF